jgi:hypothetical protein
MHIESLHKRGRSELARKCNGSDLCSSRDIDQYLVASATKYHDRNPLVLRACSHVILRSGAAVLWQTTTLRLSFLPALTDFIVPILLKTMSAKVSPGKGNHQPHGVGEVGDQVNDTAQTTTSHHSLLVQPAQHQLAGCQLSMHSQPKQVHTRSIEHLPALEMTLPDDVPVAVVNSQFANRSQRVGNGFKRVREQYLRADLPCCCLPGLQAASGATPPRGGALSHVAPYFVVPMGSTLDVYMDVIETAVHTMPDMLILGSVLNRMRALGYARTLDKVNALLAGAAGASRRVALFADTNFSGHRNLTVDVVGRPAATDDGSHDAAHGDSPVLQALRWVREHMHKVQPNGPIVNLVILTENDEFAAVATAAGFPAFSCFDFVRSPYCDQSHAEYQTLVRICESIAAEVLEEATQAAEREVAESVSYPRSFVRVSNLLMILPVG